MSFVKRSQKGDSDRVVVLSKEAFAAASTSGQEDVQLSEQQPSDSEDSAKPQRSGWLLR